MISQNEHKILVSPIGVLEKSLVEQIMKGVSKSFGCLVESTHLIDNIDFSLDRARNQYHSTAILKKLEPLAPPGSTKLLAICQVDLFIPILTHVYGEAQLGGKTCIVSTYRLNENLPIIRTESTYSLRVIKEAIHELGHTFNLRHCPDQSCCMHYCRTISDVDRKSDQFCRYCKTTLEYDMKRQLKM